MILVIDTVNETKCLALIDQKKSKIRRMVGKNTTNELLKSKTVLSIPS